MTLSGLLCALLAATPPPATSTCPAVPDPPTAPEPVFEAAACLAEAGRWPAAARLYERVLAEAPAHPLAETSLRRLVHGHRAIADYGAAADHAEAYATRYPKAPEAPDMLLDAATLRLGLGQREQALADLDLHERQYAREHPELAAAVYWSRRELLTDDDQRLAHARAYLQRHGKSAGREGRVAAEALIVGIEWRRSCDRDARADLCITLERDPPAPRTATSCAPPRTKLTVRTRDRTRARAAQEQLTRLAQLVREVQVPDDDPRRRQALEQAAAMVRVYAADSRLEAFLAVLPPRGLGFAVDGSLPPRELAAQRRRRDDSVRRFSEYHERTTATARALEQEYAEIAAGRTTWAVAAAARIGLLREHLAESLRTIEVPREITEPPLRALFCKQMAEQADPLHAAALAAYERCLARAIYSGGFDEHARLCERALLSLERDKYPPLVELFGDPIYTASRPDPVGLQPFPR